MRVAVVGAGMAGLAAARSLADAGHEVVVFERSRGPGGRAATRRKDGFVWDVGAGYIEEPMLAHIPRDDLVRIDKPVWLYNGGAPQAGRPTPPRYAYREGNNALGKRLARGLDVRFEHRIETLVGLREEYDATVLAGAIPQILPLLDSVGEVRDLGGVRYRSCFAVGLGYEGASPDVPYIALMAREVPLGWLSLESAKCPERAPQGCCSFVAQLSEAYSEGDYERPREPLIEVAKGYLRDLYGMGEPVAAETMRWTFSQPMQTVEFDAANPPGARILIASDGLTGGKLHHAYAAGLRAAERVKELE